MHKTIKTIGLAAAFAIAGAGMAVAQDTGLTVELNKLENVENGCQTFFLFRNDTAQNFTGFEMSLAILTPDGIIDRLLTIDAAPLPANRTTLKLFEIPDTQCETIGEILLHDIGSCQPQNGEEMDCFSILTLNSRASAQLVK